MKHKRLWQMRLWVLFVLLAVAASGCSGGDVGLAAPERASVTTSWLDCALRDVTGDRFEILQLCPPGTCPGHFDMKPSQLSAMRGCSILVRFDFQKGLDAKLSRMLREGLNVVPVTAGEGLCVPGTYLDSCRQVAAGVIARYPDLKNLCSAELEKAETRLAALGEEVRRRVKDTGLVGKKVITSPHQAAFAGWLGLDVVGTFRGSESETVRSLAGLIARSEKQDVAFVVANLQEGDRQARALGERLRARVVVFSNFPAAKQTFDCLVRANVDLLLEAAEK